MTQVAVVNLPTEDNFYAYKTLQDLKVLTDRGDVLWENYLDGFKTNIKGVRVFFVATHKERGSAVTLNGKNIFDDEFLPNPIFAKSFSELEQAIYHSSEISLGEAQRRIRDAI